MPDRDPVPADETLIAFVQGRLPPPKMEAIRGRAAVEPSLAAEIALLRGIAAEAARVADDVAPGELGWARLSRAIDREHPQREAAEPPRKAPLRRPIWQLAAAAAAAVVLWQGVAAPLFTGPGEVGYQPVSEAPASDPALRVAFAPDATEAEIRALLKEIGARVSDGPSAIGLWDLTFVDETARAAGRSRLDASPIVESVQ